MEQQQQQQVQPHHPDSSTVSSPAAQVPPIVLPSGGSSTTPGNDIAPAVTGNPSRRRRIRRKTTTSPKSKNISSIHSDSSNSSRKVRKVDPDDDEDEEEDAYGGESGNSNKNAVRSKTNRRRNRHRNQQPQQQHGAAVFVHRTKEGVWDSNELSIEAALCAVDHWESVYRTVRTVLVQAGMTLQTLYGTAKQSAQSLEDGVWRPYRDWIVGPTLSGLERVGRGLAHCHNHPETRRLANQLLTVTRQVPIVGPHVLAPTLVGTTTALQHTWRVVQSPIPSRERVRHTVDATLTTLKWGLVQSVTAVQAYLQRVDASLTRIWCHTQWQVLGSGPYITLNTANQQLVLDHLVERYFNMMDTTSTSSMILPEHDNDITKNTAMEDGEAVDSQHNNHNVDCQVRRKNMLARYEWAAHVRWHNPVLYADWRDRLLSLFSGSTTQDEWWKAHPVYRDIAKSLMWWNLEQETTTSNIGLPPQCTIGTPFLVPLPQPQHDLDGPDTPLQQAAFDGDDDGWSTHDGTSITTSPIHDNTPSALWFVRPSSSSMSPSGDASSRWRILASQREQRILEERYQQIVEQQRIHVIQDYDSGVLRLEEVEEEENLRNSPLRMEENRRIPSRSDYSDNTTDGNVDCEGAGPWKDDSLLVDLSSSDGIESDSGDDDENDDDNGNTVFEPLDRIPTAPRRSQQPTQPPFPSSKPRNKNRSSTPTIAQWYTPTHHDILVDQQRHAISFFAICPKCRQLHKNHDMSGSPNRHPNTPLATSATEHSVEDLYGKDCDYCRHHIIRKDPTRRSDRTQSMPHLLPFPPPIGIVMRPTFWRFYGPGDEVRRAIWFLETPRHGLQPFDEEAHAVLEDAYLFLQWIAHCRRRESTRSINSSCHSTDSQQQECRPKQSDDSDGNNLDASLLTVEVNCPDGIARLVQFSSLTQATAIQKGMGAAIAIFKRRVYRGAWLINRGNPSSNKSSSSPAAVDVDDPDQPPPTTPTLFSFDQAIALAVQENGYLGETMVPNVSLRSLLEPPLSSQPRRSSEVDLLLSSSMMDYDASLAVPPERLANEDIAKYLLDEHNNNSNSKDGSKIDHLCLVVHGIGEMLRSIDVFGMSLQNLSDCCRSMRRNHAQVLDAHFAQMYPHANATVWAQCSTGRVEYLPIEWHESFSILTQRKVAASDDATTHPDSCHRNSHRNENNNKNNTVMMQDISLRTIPNMREFANDTLMDVLFFMSPEHHDIIIDLVTKEMNLGTFRAADRW